MGQRTWSAPTVLLLNQVRLTAPGPMFGEMSVVQTLTCVLCVSVTHPPSHRLTGQVIKLQEVGLCRCPRRCSPLCHHEFLLRFPVEGEETLELLLVLLKPEESDRSTAAGQSSSAAQPQTAVCLFTEGGSLISCTHMHRLHCCVTVNTQQTHSCCDPHLPHCLQ